MPNTDPLLDRIQAACTALPLEQVPVRDAMLAGWASIGAAWNAPQAPPVEVWARALCVSPYLRRQLSRHPEWLLPLLRGDLPTMALTLPADADMAVLQQVLRQFRQRWMCAIIWRELQTPDAYPNTVADLTRLAETCLQSALDWVQNHLRARYGLPQDDSGQATPLVILGMGKLGGGELNLSSDIDLIFAYAAPGQSSGPERIDNSEYFTRLGRQLVQALAEVTADGFVFRVDLRLRPFGEAGPLALPGEAMLQYYQSHGREWERYAWIKARPVAGDIDFGQTLVDALRPFVYRRYLDYTTLDALREIKALIDAEVRRKGRQQHVKLGPGGIREIEFIVQSLQLVRGGQVAALRRRDTLGTLQVLGQLGLLPAQDVPILSTAYRFLRDLEHRLQWVEDAQTHSLPESPEERARIALAMGFTDWAALQASLQGQRDHVQILFQQCLGNKVTAAPAPEQALWQRALDANAGEELSAEYDLSATAWHWLRRFAQSTRVTRQMSATARQRLDQLLPILLQQCARSGQVDILLPRFIQLLEAIHGRDAYLALLLENPQALPVLAQLLLQSPWLTHELCRFPALLDEALWPHAQALDRDALATQLQGEADLEGRLDRLRYFRRSEFFRLARAVLLEDLPPDGVMTQLTRLAETLLEAVLTLAWADLVQSYGTPAAQFCIIGLGKLGSAEMRFHSDLDLIFIHDADANSATTGANPVPSSVFFARLGQRIIHYLTASTGAGLLYPIDMRLRPSGHAGPLVTSLTQFRDYQLHQAWTWEQQALTCARPIAGSAALQQAFEALRRSVLTQPRDPGQLRPAVAEMRQRMLAAHPDQTACFDLKHSPGGLIDLEFLVQYGRLLMANQSPTLIEARDLHSGLADLAQHGLWSKASASALQQAARDYHELVLRLQLLEHPNQVTAAEALALQASLPHHLHPLWENIEQHRRQVRQVWQACLQT